MITRNYFTLIRKSIFFRIFITFLMIVAPIFVAGLGIYDWGFSAISSGIEGSIQSQNDYFLDDLEKEFKRIAMLQYRILDDRVLNRLALSDFLKNDYDKNMEMMDVQERINIIKSSSKFVKDIRVHIPAINKTITSTTILDMDDNATDLMNIFPKLTNKQFVLWKNKFLLVSEYPERQSNVDEIPLIFIETEFSTIELEKLLKELNIYEKSDSFIFIKDIHLLICNDENRELCEQIKEVADSKNNSSDIYNSQLKSQSKDSKVFSAKVSGQEYLVIVSMTENNSLSIIRYVAKDILFRKVSLYRILFWTFAFIVILIIPIFTISTYRFIHRPLTKLVKAFARLEKGDMNFEIVKHSHDDEFRYIYEHFNNMVKNLNSLIDQLYRQTIMVQKAELKQLQSQINPHFLYNSFFILKRKIKLADNEEAMYFAQQMGNYFKYITRSAADEVPLEKEVGHARIYAEIQELRFSNRIKIDFEELPEEFKNIYVPRIILQPLIENSFVYGLEKKEKDGRISMRFRSDNNLLMIIIEDNGDCLAESELDKMQKSLQYLGNNMEVTGIVNIHRRLRLKYGGSSGLILCRGDSGGLKVIVNLELKEEGTDV